jgi:pimeloyl-ACP methyl ester carboxylesterase
MTRQTVRGAGAIAVCMCLFGACSSGSPSEEGSAASPTASETESSSGTETEAIEGTFDVGGHELYINCAGSGAPTIIYLHGSINEPSVDPHSNGLAIQDRLADDYRMCVYDRRNLAHSDTVDAPQLPSDAIKDLESLLSAAEIEPPYVLLGASFGGLLSYVYLNEHPDDVVGMVLLDSPLPDELQLEHLVPPADRYKAFDKEDENETLERISHYKTFKAASKYIGDEPDVPVIYFTSGKEPAGIGDPKYDKKYRDLRAAYVDRFSPGKLVEADAPHFMEPAIPDEIADAVREVIELGGN